MQQNQPLLTNVRNYFSAINLIGGGLDRFLANTTYITQRVKFDELKDAFETLA